MKFRCVSTHPEDLDGGRVLAPGEYLENISQEDVDKSERLQQLLADELLLPVSEKGEELADRAERKVARREKEVTG